MLEHDRTPPVARRRATKAHAGLALHRRNVVKHAGDEHQVQLRRCSRRVAFLPEMDAWIGLARQVEASRRHIGSHDSPRPEKAARRNGMFRPMPQPNSRTRAGARVTCRAAMPTL